MQILQYKNSFPPCVKSQATHKSTANSPISGVMGAQI